MTKEPQAPWRRILAQAQEIEQLMKRIEELQDERDRLLEYANALERTQETTT